MNTLQPQSGELLRLGDQLVRFDRACTADAYERIITPGAEECGCAGCRNFIPQRNTAYPDSFRKLLQQLGIDSNKEGEVYYIAPEKNGERLYGGWFFFCGELLQAGEKQIEADGISYSVIGPGRMPSPYPADRFGPHALALEFHIRLPWLISSSDDPDFDKTEASRSKQ